MTAIPSIANDVEVNDLLVDSVLPWRASSTPRVLIVEDDADIQRGWSLFLHEQGYEVQAVSDGATGIDAIEATEPDIVLLDLGLPGMHGFKVLHEIRMRGIPCHVIVVTASVSSEAERRAIGQGAEVMLSKPVSPHRLVSVIERVLGG